MKDIQLRNRYTKFITLKNVGENEYKFDLDKLHYLRYIYADVHTVLAVDPEGGPYLAVGDMVEGKKITNITKDGVITIE